MTDRDVAVERKPNGQPDVGQSQDVDNRHQPRIHEVQDRGVTPSNHHSQRPCEQPEDEHQGIGDSQGLEHRRDSTKLALPHVTQHEEGDDVTDDAHDCERNGQPHVDDHAQQFDGWILMTAGAAICAGRIVGQIFKVDDVLSVHSENKRMTPQSNRIYQSPMKN